jgi:hypothetical protein
VSLPIQKKAAKATLMRTQKSAMKNCVAADSKIDSQTMLPPIQRSATKTMSLSILKSAPKNCVTVDSEISSKNCVAADSEISNNGGVISGFTPLFFFWLGVYNVLRLMLLFACKFRLG